MSATHTYQIKSYIIFVYLVSVFLFISAPAHSAQVTLIWDPGDIAPDGYRIFQRTESGSYDYSVPTWSGAETTCTLDNLTEGETYYYVVRAYISGDESPDSNEIVFSSNITVLPSYTITSTAQGNGSISPNGITNITSGSSQSYGMSPLTGYFLRDVLVDGKSVGAVSAYTFSSVTDNHSITALFDASNIPPTADAGPDQTAFEGQMVVLSAANSMDPDDGIAMFQWQQIQGPSVGLSSITEEETSFQAPAVGTEGAALVFELTATDYSGASAKDTCIINIVNVNMPPIANAGADQTFTEGTQVYLDGTGSYDPDDGIATYQWTQVQGPVVTLSDYAAARPFFQLPQADSRGTSVTFELTVTDFGGLQDTDSCIVTIQSANNPPMANAGPDLETLQGQDVMLDGTQSSDPDDGIALYSWRQTAGTPVLLSDITSPNPVFTAPAVGPEGTTLTFELTVVDHGDLRSVDDCQVKVLSGVLQQDDTIPPEVTILEPAENPATVNGVKITITGNAWDNVNVDRVVWSNDLGDSGIAEGTTVWQISNLRLSKGLNTITITAYDSAGNFSSATIKLYWGK